jgi:CheY-like chemotaxis protein
LSQQPQPQRPRVLVADDDAGIRTAISRLLSASCDVVGCALDSATLLEATVRLRPDVVLLDFSLPGGLNGLEVCRRIKAMAPEVNVVAFTGTNDADLRRLAQEAGASGFVWKIHAANDLLPTIHAAIDSRERC